jgi:hypothetical protein
MRFLILGKGCLDIKKIMDGTAPLGVNPPLSEKTAAQCFCLEKKENAIIDLVGPNGVNFSIEIKGLPAKYINQFIEKITDGYTAGKPA